MDRRRGSMRLRGHSAYRGRRNVVAVKRAVKSKKSGTPSPKPAVLEEEMGLTATYIAAVDMDQIKEGYSSGEEEIPKISKAEIKKAGEAAKTFTREQEKAAAARKKCPSEATALRKGPEKGISSKKCSAEPNVVTKHVSYATAGKTALAKAVSGNKVRGKTTAGKKAQPDVSMAKKGSIEKRAAKTVVEEVGQKKQMIQTRGIPASGSTSTPLLKKEKQVASSTAGVTEAAAMGGAKEGIPKQDGSAGQTTTQVPHVIATELRPVTVSALRRDTSLAGMPSKPRKSVEFKKVKRRKRSLKRRRSMMSTSSTSSVEASERSHLSESAVPSASDKVLGSGEEAKLREPPDSVKAEKESAIIEHAIKEAAKTLEDDVKPAQGELKLQTQIKHRTAGEGTADQKKATSEALGPIGKEAVDSHVPEQSTESTETASTAKRNHGKEKYTDIAVETDDTFPQPEPELQEDTVSRPRTSSLRRAPARRAEKESDEFISEEKEDDFRVEPKAATSKADVRKALAIRKWRTRGRYAPQKLHSYTPHLFEEEEISEDYYEPSQDATGLSRPLKVFSRKRMVRKYSENDTTTVDATRHRMRISSATYDDQDAGGPYDSVFEGDEDEDNGDYMEEASTEGSPPKDTGRRMERQPQNYRQKHWKRQPGSPRLRKTPSYENYQHIPDGHGAVAETKARPVQDKLPTPSALRESPHSVSGRSGAFTEHARGPLSVCVQWRNLPATRPPLRIPKATYDYGDERLMAEDDSEEYYGYSSSRELPAPRSPSRSTSSQERLVSRKRRTQVDAWDNIETWLDTRFPQGISRSAMSEPSSKTTRLRPSAAASAARSDISDEQLLSNDRRRSTVITSTSPLPPSLTKRIVAVLKRIRDEKRPPGTFVPPSSFGFSGHCGFHEIQEHMAIPADPAHVPCCATHQEGFFRSPVWFGYGSDQLVQEAEERRAQEKEEIDKLLRDLEKEELVREIQKRLIKEGLFKTSQHQQGKKKMEPVAAHEMTEDPSRRRTPSVSGRKPRPSSPAGAPSGGVSKARHAGDLPDDELVISRRSFAWSATKFPSSAKSVQTDIVEMATSASWRSFLWRSPVSSTLSFMFSTPSASREGRPNAKMSGPTTDSSNIRSQSSREFTGIYPPELLPSSESTTEHKLRDAHGIKLRKLRDAEGRHERHVPSKQHSSASTVGAGGTFPHTLPARMTPTSESATVSKQSSLNLNGRQLQGGSITSPTLRHRINFPNDRQFKWTTRLLRSTLPEEEPRHTRLTRISSGRSAPSSQSTIAVTERSTSEQPVAGSRSGTGLKAKCALCLMPIIRASVCCAPPSDVEATVHVQESRAVKDTEGNRDQLVATDRMALADSETEIQALPLVIAHVESEQQETAEPPPAPGSEAAEEAEMEILSYPESSVSLYPECKVVGVLSIVCAVWVLIVLMLGLFHHDEGVTEKTTRSFPQSTTSGSRSTPSGSHTRPTASTVPPTKSIYYCDTEYCRKEGAYLSSILNDKIDPCDDFYGYVCDIWERNAAFPATDPVWVVSTDTLIESAIEADTARYLKDPSNAARVSPAGELYEVCLDGAKVGNTGVDYARELFRMWKIGEWPLPSSVNSVEADVWDFAGELLRDFGLGPLVTVTIVSHPSDTKNRIIALGQPKPMLIAEDLLLQPVVDILKLAVNETAAAFSAYDPNGLYTDIMLAFSSFSAVAGSASSRDIELKLVKVLDVNDGFRSLLKKVFHNVVNVDHDTQLLLLSPDFVQRRLEGILRSMSPRTLLNYIGFRAMIILAPLLSKSLTHLLKLFSLDISGRISSLSVQSSCLRAVQRVLPACLLRAYGSSRTRDDVTYRLWLSQIENVFLRSVDRIAWFDKVTALLLRYRFKNTYVEAFFPPELVTGTRPCGPSYAVNKSGSPLRTYFELSIQQQQEAIQEIFRQGAWQTGLPDLFDTSATYNLPRQTVMVPVGVLNASVPTNATMFDFHQARMALRVYRALVRLLFQASLYEEETSLRFTDDSDLVIEDLQSCLVRDFRNLPARLRNQSHHVVSDAEWIQHRLLEQTTAVQLAFRAYQELLHIRRILNVDFRLSLVPRIPADQLFFVYYALDNCEYSDIMHKRHEYLIAQKTPPEAQVNAVLRHVDYFRSTFRCESGMAMRLPQAAVCKVFI